jgi:hypothetical protein
MANTDFNIRIKVDDGRAKVQIDGLTEGFVDAGTAVAKLRAEIERNGKAMEGTAKWYRQQISFLKEQRDMSAKTASDYARQTKAIEQVQVKYRELSTGVRDFNKVNQDQISNSGLAGATLTELGRTVSDLPYGIRGVANNLSQLSTLFITLTAKTDGFKNSIKLLLTELRGPLGYILAFQAVISLLDFFSQKQNEAKESTEVIGNEFGESAAKLRTYQKILNDTNIAEKEKVTILKEVAEETDGLNLEIDENNRLTIKSNDLLTTNIEKLKKQAEIRAIVDRITKLNSEKLALEFELQEKLSNKYSAMLLGLAKTPNMIGQIAKTFRISGALPMIESMEDIDKEITKLLEKLRGESLGFLGEDGTEKDKQFIDDFNRWYTKQNDRLQEKLAIDEIARLEAERLSRSNNISQEISDRKDKEKKALDDGLITQEEYNIRLNLLEKLRLDKLAQLNEEYDTKVANARLNAFMSGLEKVSAAMDTLYEAEISREERRTTAANNELKKRLKNEQLSAEQKEAINAQIEANEENLQRKRDKIAEKQFKLQKAVNIASALAETYRTGVLAFGSQLIIGDPSSPVRAQIAQAVAIAAGLANVAAIARQQFVPSAIGGAGGGGAGGAGGGMQAPDFNVVGASAQSQLAEAVGTAESQPVRAFVVGKDISTQQELDRNINDTASFG